MTTRRLTNGKTTGPKYFVLLKDYLVMNRAVTPFIILMILMSKRGVAEKGQNDSM